MKRTCEPLRKGATDHFVEVKEVARQSRFVAVIFRLAEVSHLTKMSSSKDDLSCSEYKAKRPNQKEFVRTPPKWDTPWTTLCRMNTISKTAHQQDDDSKT